MQHFKTLKQKTETRNQTDSSSLCGLFGIVFCDVSGFTVLAGCGMYVTADCRNQTKRKGKINGTAFSFSNMLQGKKKLPFECPVSYRSQISATTKDFVLQVPPNALGGSHLRG